MTQTTTMRATIESILASHELLERFKHSRHFHARIASKGFMPLTIERHDSRVVVAHYFEQNGDLVPDPDVEFVDLGDADWLPVAIQHSTGHYCVTAQQAEGTGNWLVSTRAMADLKSFLKMWARNLASQGFARGEVIRSSAD